MHRLLLLGLNHTTAPLEVREKLAFNAAQCRQAIAAFSQKFPEAEAVLLSTCNRVELYVGRSLTAHAEPHPSIDELVAFLGEFHAVPPAVFSEHLYHKVDRRVVQHLFAVASSLDSMVLGETQVLGQVRSAYELSGELSAARGLLNPLFQRSLAIGKQVMTQTTLAEGRLSVASVAIDYARRIFDHFDDKTILCVGAGKMVTLALQSFAGLRPRRLLLANRDPAKAQALARRFSGEAVDFDRLNEHLVQADVVLTSTGATHPIITRQQFEPLGRLRRYRPIFLIDIAVPRDIEAAVGELQNVYLYNLDDLQQVVAQTRTQRGDSIAAASQIVEAGVEEYVRWHQAREAGPVIDQLYRRYHRLAQEELSRALNKMPELTPAQRAQFEETIRRVVNKLLHQPVQSLRRAQGGRGQSGQYLHAIQNLFQPEEATPEESNPDLPA